ncbi:hypothetical protein GCM10027343_15590 [Noviherbaspirillum agri]
MFKDPYTMTVEDLEYEWIQLKADLMMTSPYKQELSYQRQYERARQLLKAVLSRHWHIVRDAECKTPFYHYVRSGLIPHISVPTLEHVQTETLLGLVLVSYVGGRTETTSVEVVPDTGFVQQTIDFLVNERKAPAAFFLKGLVLKYGAQLFLPPNPIAARRYLEKAMTLGVGAAKTELEFLALHERALTNAKTIHEDYNDYQLWINAA